MNLNFLNFNPAVFSSAVHHSSDPSFLHAKEPALEFEKFGKKQNKKQNPINSSSVLEMHTYIKRYKSLLQVCTYILIKTFSPLSPHWLRSSSNKLTNIES